MRILPQLVLLLLLTTPLFAGTPKLNLNCKSLTGEMSISGFPRGEGYDLKITMDNSVLRYVDICVDAECSKTEKQGELFVVEALNKKVFTIYFVLPVEGGKMFMGQFYALPDTVRYTKTARGYKAEYKAIYDGADPRSKSIPKEYLKTPAQLICLQQEEL